MQKVPAAISGGFYLFDGSLYYSCCAKQNIMKIQNIALYLPENTV